MAELPSGRVSHLSTGRLRVKVPQKRGDAAFFKTVEERLRSWDSIARVETNPLTASILVFFADLTALYLENEAKNDLFSLAYDELETETVSIVERASGAFTSANATVNRWTGGAADLRGTIFVVLLLAGVTQLMRGNIAAPAATLLWYAGAALRLWDADPAGAIDSAARSTEAR